MQQSKIKKSLASLLLLFCFATTAQAAQITSVIPIGHTVGIKMDADGVLVVRLDEVKGEDGSACPARYAGVQEGDLIVSVNGERIDSNDALQKNIALSAGRQIELEIARDGKTQKLTVVPCADRKGVYRIGVLGRDSIAGVGTLTYVDPVTGAYGSLGHGVCDSETGVLMPLQAGSLLYSVVGEVQRGKVGEPGALQGEFDVARQVGTVTENTENGVYGKLTDSALYSRLQAVPVASVDEVQTGEAEILANVAGDEVGRYKVQIVRLYPEDDEYGRGMMIRVTDPKLIEQTGGIVQGMSGSPVLQNGKLVAAVTHVLVNDPTCGYAIGIEKMIEEMTN